MGGLLDKAKSASTPEEKPAEKPKSQKESLLSNFKPSVKQTKSDQVTNVDSDGPDIPMILNIVGWVVILIGALLSLQGGAWGLIVILVVLIIGIGSLVQSQRMSQNISKPRMIMSIALAVLIATGPYIALVLIPNNSNIVVTEVTMNEEDDTISFVVRGTFDSVDVEISHDGVELWSDSGETSFDRISFTVPIAEIFVTNSMDYRGPFDGVLEDYVISAESSKGQKSSTKINPAYLTRELNNAAVRINQIDKPNQDGVVEVVGLQVEVSLGLLSPSMRNLVNGNHSAINAYSISADYTVDVRIYQSPSNTLWQQSTQDSLIEVDGFDAEWQCTKSGSGKKIGSTEQNWLGLCGTVDGASVEYIEKDEFYNEDGCYTFEVIITNELYENQAVTVIDSNSWELEWDDRGTESTLSTC